MTPTKYVPRCPRHPRASTAIEYRAGGHSVWICTSCVPLSSHGARVLGLASIGQPGHLFEGTLRRFSWKGEVPSSEWQYIRDPSLWYTADEAKDDAKDDVNEPSDDEDYGTKLIRSLSQLGIVIHESSATRAEKDSILAKLENLIFIIDNLLTSWSQQR